jgi:hypothetical protein
VAASPLGAAGAVRPEQEHSYRVNLLGAVGDFEQGVGV